MKKRTIEAEVVIVGSGTVGATLAKELAKRRKKVVLVEKGRREASLGRMVDGLRFYEKHTFLKSKEGTVLYETSMVGGTSVVASGNALRCSQKELYSLGIDLENEFREAESELKASPLPDRCLSQGSHRILSSAQSLGLEVKRVPKFIDPHKCIRCGSCVMGCRYNAKWSAVNYVDEAVKHGARVLTRTKAKRVLVKNNKAEGVEAVGADGKPVEIKGEKVIIAAGGIQTPIILQNTGISKAGKKMFCDPFMTCYGTIKDCSQVNGVNAPGYVLKPGRFILFPVIDPAVQFYVYTGWRSLSGKISRSRAIGMMVKIADEPVGKVYSDGTIEKPITLKDREKFNEGIGVIKEIFRKSGADPKSVFTIKQVRGPHPGGTAAIGEVVDNNLETEIRNLFVCDNSVLPQAPGLPPIVTLIALSKWLSKRLAV